MFIQKTSIMKGISMNIVVNAVLSHDKPRGVGRYINNLLPTIAELDREIQYYVYYGKWMQEYDFLKIERSNIHFVEVDIKNTQILRNLYLAIKLPLECRKLEPDIFWLIDTQAIIIKPCKIVSTIHDLAEYVVPEKYSQKQAIIRKLIVKHQIKISDSILTVSQYSKKDICRRFGISEEKVHVTYNAVEEPMYKSKGETDNYFLFVSEIERAKNLILLIKAYILLPKSMREKYVIYVVGKKGNDYENIIDEIQKNHIMDRVKFFGYVSDEELNKLYARAYAFVFPSLFEGFGLPVLEAMAKGTPVLCSDSSSIPEVGGDAVLTFNPYDENELLEQMIKLIENPNIRTEMIDRGIKRASIYNKIDAACDTLDVFRKV